MSLLRSNVEFSKRVFLDRLTTDVQGLPQAGTDAGPGDDYVYAACYDWSNFGVGADCSGSAGIFIGAALLGAQGMSWTRQFSTETFPGGFKGFRQVAKADLLQGNYPIKVCIHHGGGGPNSHMQIQIDGIVMESNGSHGTCTAGSGAMDPADNYWNDWWVLDGPITEDTTERCTMSYPKGFDYAGGRPSGVALKAAGAAFACRYLTDGGPNLPGKQLLASELADLVANGIAVVFNWETTATFMLGGAAAGRVDAAQALAYIHSIGGPAHPVVYFSADWDESPDQQDAVNAYLSAAAEVLGGAQYVGVYGAYYLCQRALNAGVCKYTWQTEAWSGGNIDSRVNIMQRNGAGYSTVSGVQCDLDEAHTDDFGQYTGAATQPVAPTPPTTAARPTSDTMISLMYDQICLTWEELGKRTDGKSDRTLVDGIAHLIGDPNA